MKNKIKTRKHETAEDNTNSFQDSGATLLSKQQLQSVPPEKIRRRAHEIHLARGGGLGRELDDWLQAEREFQAEQERPVDSGEQMGATDDGGKPPFFPGD